MASLNADSFRKIYERSDQFTLPLTPIYFDLETVSWPDFTLDWDAGWKIKPAALTHPQNFTSMRKADDSQFNFLGLSESKLSVWRLISQTQSFAKVAEYSMASSVLPDDILVEGADVLLLSSEGISLLRSGKSLPTSLTIPHHKIILHKSSDAFVQDKSAVRCLWRHFTNNDRLANSFKESGFVVPCAKQESFTANEKSVSVSSFNAEIVTIDSLKKYVQTSRILPLADTYFAGPDISGLGPDSHKSS